MRMSSIRGRCATGCVYSSFGRAPRCFNLKWTEDILAELIYHLRKNNPPPRTALSRYGGSRDRLAVELSAISWIVHLVVVVVDDVDDDDDDDDDGGGGGGGDSRWVERPLVGEVEHLDQQVRDQRWKRSKAALIVVTLLCPRSRFVCACARCQPSVDANGVVVSRPGYPL